MKHIIFILNFIFISFTNTTAQTHWSFELHGGEVYNVPLPLILHQQGYPDIKSTARFTTEPLNAPVYWDGRISRWKDGKSWELEAIHHKLYLVNTTSEIQKFNISHGFNMIFVNRGIQIKSFRYHSGVGMVIAHPESTIRGREFGASTDDFDMGYFLSGPALAVAVSRPFYIGNRLFINAEAKTTVAYSSIKIAQGHADVYNIAFHLLLGVGMDSR